VRAIFEPAPRVLPAFGFWARTLPFFLRLENFLRTLPTLQCALTIFDRALASFRPWTYGTLHFCAGGGYATVVDAEAWPLSP